VADGREPATPRSQGRAEWPEPIDCESVTEDDFTFYRSDEPEFQRKLSSYIPPDEVDRVCKSAGIPLPKPPDNVKPKILKFLKSVEATMLLQDPAGNLHKGRVNACRCMLGNFWSLTCRLELPDKAEGRKKKSKGSKDLKPASRVRHPHSLWKANPEYGKHLNSFEDLCRVLYPEIFPKGTAKHTGLLVVAGTTHSGKSEISRGLLDEYLIDLRNRGMSRRLHLVTFEDPIEQFYDPTVSKSLSGLKYPHRSNKYQRLATHLNDPARWLDYTPRQGLWDADSLGHMLKDALRQTPTVVMVGETRSDADWPYLIRFARSGHLIATTAHAGSLTEAMSRILVATKADTPQKRRQVADCLLAIVHLRANPERKPKLLLPSLWRHTPAGLNALVADGLESLVPCAEEEPGTSCFGRYRFVDDLLRHRLAAAIRKPKLKNVSSAAQREFRWEATEWDLGGV